jgi:hypothetical protein
LAREIFTFIFSVSSVVSVVKKLLDHFIIQSELLFILCPVQVLTVFPPLPFSRYV